MFQTIISIIAFAMLSGAAIYTLCRDRSQGGFYLCLALLATALLELFDLCALNFPAVALDWKRYALFVEAMLPPLWLLCSVTYARWQGRNNISRLMTGIIAVSFIFILFPCIYPSSAFFYAPDFPVERLLFFSTSGWVYYVAIMTFLILALINFEATLTSATPDALSRIKFDIVGLGSILAVLIFYYSQALLYRTINMSYTPLRSFMFIMAIGMIAYSRLYRIGTVRVYVAPSIAVRSFVLVAVAIYLILLGLLGEGMRHLNALIPRSLYIGIFFVSGVAFLLAILSEKVRREIKVRLHKSFYQNKYDYRTQWLRFTERLATSSGEELSQRILSAYCEIFGLNGAALFLYNRECASYSAVAQYMMRPISAQFDAENSLIRYMIESGWVFSIRDNNETIRRENAEFLADHSVSFVVPLFDGSSLAGFIVLGDVLKKNESFIYEDYDLMKTIARQASHAILNQQLSEQLTKAREMEAIGNMATFVVHDLKNLASTLSLIVDNASRYMQNPDFQTDMLASLSNTSTKMHALIGRLKNLGQEEQLKLRKLDLLDLAENTARLLPAGKVACSGHRVHVFADESELQKVILNLLMNAIEASAADAMIMLETGQGEAPYFRVIDNGCGMSPQFLRSELFSPFRTTKKTGLGIGLYQCRKIISAHGGRIEVSSTEGSGSIFTVLLPVTDSMISAQGESLGKDPDR